jgi:hypothetical protein
MGLAGRAEYITDRVTSRYPPAQPFRNSRDR